MTLIRSENENKFHKFRSLAEHVLSIHEPSKSAAVQPQASEQLHGPRGDSSCVEGASTMKMRTISADDAQVCEVHRSSDERSFSHEHPEERLLAEVELFRIRAVEALESSLERLLLSCVEEVLGRELALAPVELRSIVDRLLRRYEREGPLRLRVSPIDVSSIVSSLPIVADSTLEPGDLVIEVRDGELDARLPVRLSCATARLDRHQLVARRSETIPTITADPAVQARLLEALAS